MAPSLGVSACATEGEESPYLRPKEFLASISYRYLNSFRDFHGDDEIPFPSPPGLLADTRVHGFVLSVTYQATSRLSLSLELPFQKGSRATYYEHDFIGLTTRATMRAVGFGDLRLIGSYWLLNPTTCRHGNIALQLGVKFPTGVNDATDIAYRPTGPVERPVSAAIQPGDGTWGIVAGLDAFAKIYKNLYAYVQGTYLLNPEETTGVEDTNADIPDYNLGLDQQFKFNSAPDQYLGRAGFGYVLWPKWGLTITLGGRIEGVPSADLIGGSLGTRLAGGYAVYIEPGLSVTKDRFSFAVSVPVALYRIAEPNVSDALLAERLGVPFDGKGTAAFADYLITTTFSLKF